MLFLSASLHKLRSAPLFGQLLRYGLVGVLSNIAAYLSYLWLCHMGLSPKYSVSLLFAAVSVTGFIANRNFTFRHQGSFVGAGVRYFAAQGCAYILNLSILEVFVNRLGYKHEWVQACACVVIALFLFCISRFFIFRLPEKKAQKSA